MPLSPQECFSEMSPIICTSDIPFETIGQHMQSHAKRCGLGDKPRRLLVGGMRARKILLATPLLKWYLDHGMEVTRVYQVVECCEQSCFKRFADEGTNSRRAGDADKDAKIIAALMKLVGNSAFVSLIMDKEKHQRIAYLQGIKKVTQTINDPLFRKLTELGKRDQFFEVEMAKRVIKLDLPIQLGYFVLQYAKLRMLQFYYDFFGSFCFLIRL